jgi:hypothetical protein
MRGLRAAASTVNAQRKQRIFKHIPAIRRILLKRLESLSSQRTHLPAPSPGMTQPQARLTSHFQSPNIDRQTPLTPGTKPPRRLFQPR